MKLSDAQWVIAREYGFASWPALKAFIEHVTGQAPEGTYSVLAWNEDGKPTFSGTCASSILVPLGEWSYHLSSFLPMR